MPNREPRHAPARQVPRPENGLLKEAGTYYFADSSYGQRSYLIHACPCGCGGMSTLALAGPNAWQTKGEWSNITLTPSIGIGRNYWPDDPYTRTDGFHWHGYLTNGIFTKLP